MMSLPLRRRVVVLASPLLIWLSVALAFMAAPTGAALAAPRAGVTVGGDDGLDAYRGDGGLLLPGSFSGSLVTRNHVADCLGCRWRYTLYCAHGAEGLCLHSVATCTAGQLRYRVWFGRTDADLAVIGSVCWGSSYPLTRRDVDSSIRETAMRAVPPLRPGVDPATGTLTSVPAVFYTQQPSVYRAPSMRLAGFTIRVSAVPRWHWMWGDGQSQWVAVPGAPYPSSAVTHQYRSAGRYVAAVRTVWQASYTASGLGPFPVTGEAVTQTAAVRVLVRASRVVLTPW